MTGIALIASLILNQPAASAPETCIEIHGSYCVLDVGLKEEIISQSENILTLKVFYEDWPNKYGVIKEIGNCRSHAADVFQLKEDRISGIIYRGSEWGKIPVETRHNNGCTLEFLYSTKKNDNTENAFYIFISEVKICFTATCIGPKLGELVAARLWRNRSYRHLLNSRNEASH
jgi:hypothetical protein